METNLHASPAYADAVPWLKQRREYGRAVAAAMDAIARQPESANVISRTLFVGLAMIESLAIYCFVVSMILIFANPFWHYAIAQAK